MDGEELRPDNEGGADAYLDTIAADPVRLTRLRAAIAKGMGQGDRGEGRPASEVFADLRKQTATRREQG